MSGKLHPKKEKNEENERIPTKNFGLIYKNEGHVTVSVTAQC